MGRRTDDLTMNNGETEDLNTRKGNEGSRNTADTNENEVTGETKLDTQNTKHETIKIKQETLRCRLTHEIDTKANERGSEGIRDRAMTGWGTME